jgi:hypothetical protein
LNCPGFLLTLFAILGKIHHGCVLLVQLIRKIDSHPTVDHTPFSASREICGREHHENLDGRSGNDSVSQNE